MGAVRVWFRFCFHSMLCTAFVLYFIVCLLFLSNYRGSLKRHGQRRCRPNERAELVLGSTMIKAKKKKKKGDLQASFAAFMFKAKKMFTEKHKEIFVEVIGRAPAGHLQKES